jgi:hypothetical protein
MTIKEAETREVAAARPPAQGELGPERMPEAERAAEPILAPGQGREPALAREAPRAEGLVDPAPATLRSMGSERNAEWEDAD